MLTLIILFLLIVYIYDSNKKLKKLQEENKKLKDLLKDRMSDVDLNLIENKVSQGIVNKDAVKEKTQLSEEEKKQITLQKEKEERERKNTTILITGAVLIVLSAIVFLMSTWYTIPDILKTSVLILLISVFFGGSKIAKEKFNLEKTSKTFFYIAMAYIPICLFSISFFGLLGNFLSLQGEGRYIYLSLAGIITAFIYLITYRKTKSKAIFYGSLLSQVFSVVLFSLIFDNKIELISLNLLIYNILFIILTFNLNNNLLKNIKNIYSVIPYFSTFIMFFVYDNINLLIPANLILLAINYGILEAKVQRKSDAFLFNIAINVLGLYCIDTFDITHSFNILTSLLYFICVYVYENILLIGKNKRNLQVSCSIVSLAMLQILFFDIVESKGIFIRPYIISFVQLIILTISYIQSKEIGKKITGLLIPIYFIITGLSFLNEFTDIYHYYIIFSLITFILGESLQGKNVARIRKGFFVISNIFIVLTYLISFLFNDVDMINDVIHYVLLLAVYTYCYLKERNKIFKYITYLTGHIVIFSVCVFFDLSEDFMYLIPTITLIGLLNLENKFQFLKDNGSKIFFAILKIISYIYLNILGQELGTIISIAVTSYLIYYHNKNKESAYYNIIPLIGTMPIVFDNNLDSTLQICIMLLSTIGLTAFSIKNRKINVYTVFSGIYLYFTLLEFDTIYVNEILFVIWAYCNWYFMKNKKEKDIFKVLSYLGILFLYNEFAYSLKLTQYTVFNMLGYIVFAILMMRNVLNSYLKKIDLIEAIVYVSIYLIAITLYDGEQDGMLFGILIVSIIFLSYLKKYGTLFLTSIAALLVNVFLLTREFWFSIPWWAYLLIIGSFLITFAVKNEVSEKNEKLDFGSTLKRLKDRIEK